MSLLALGALLEGEHDYLIVDGNLERDPVAALDRAIRETGATVLGVTVMPGPQLNDAVPTCRRIKELPPRPDHGLGRLFPDPALGAVPESTLRRLRRPRPWRGGVQGPARCAAARR